MNNILKILMTVAGIVSISIVGLGLYFVVQMSGVYPPLKKYNYQLSALDVQGIILDIDHEDPSLNCIVTDTVGPKDGLKYYMEVILKRNGVNYSFHINYEDKKPFWSKSISSEVHLIGAFDSTHNMGGYKLEDKGVENLIGTFDKEFINKLDKKLLARKFK